MQITAGGHNWTKVDNETYVNENGGHWVSWERKDMNDKVRWANKEITKLAAAALAGDQDAIDQTNEALEILDDTMDDLRITDLLFPRS